MFSTIVQLNAENHNKLHLPPTKNTRNPQTALIIDQKHKNHNKLHLPPTKNTEMHNKVH